MRITPVKAVWVVLLLLTNRQHTQAQLQLTAQLRTRTEYRDGQGSPLSKGQKPAFFTSQRTRLQFLFNKERIKLGATVQDVRVWGQDVSLINRTTTADNNGLMLHEAWAEILLTDTAQKNNKLSLKIGRQELLYDDQRLLGNLDWLQQARRHDAALLKYEHNDWMIHLGAAFNQNKEKNAGTEYSNTPPGNYTASTNGGVMYKSMEFLYATKKLGKGQLSFLFFSDQFNPYNIDSVNNVPVKTFTSGSWVRATTGLYFTQSIGQLDIMASAYYQFGKNGNGKKGNGQLFSGLAWYRLGKVSAGAGVDYTSPSFDPLYGTPHKFWGLMDYYYAGSATGQHGLVDYYLRSKWKVSDRWLLAADAHQFMASGSINGYSKNYGQEVDVVATFQLTKQIGLEGGYSHYFATGPLASPTVKNIPSARSNANWAYLMVNIKPEFFFK